MTPLVVLLLFLGLISGQPTQKEVEDGTCEDGCSFLHGQIAALSAVMQHLTQQNAQLQSTVSELQATQGLPPALSSCSQAPHSGIYRIDIPLSLDEQSLVMVYCDRMADGEGWMRILRREDGLYDFPNRTWSAYEDGFGDKSGSHWLGLKYMHSLTSPRDVRLRVDLEDWEGNTRYAEYSVFRIGNASDNYRLGIGGYSGDAGDAMAFHNGQQFSTKEVDNDANGGNCAVNWGGAWWYNKCFDAHLTGHYYTEGPAPRGLGITWRQWRDYDYSCKTATMSIKPTE